MSYPSLWKEACSLTSHARTNPARLDCGMVSSTWLVDPPVRFCRSRKLRGWFPLLSVFRSWRGSVLRSQPACLGFNPKTDSYNPNDLQPPSTTLTSRTKQAILFKRSGQQPVFTKSKEKHLRHATGSSVRSAYCLCN